MWNDIRFIFQCESCDVRYRTWIEYIRTRPETCLTGVIKSRVLWKKYRHKNDIKQHKKHNTHNNSLNPSCSYRGDVHDVWNDVFQRHVSLNLFSSFCCWESSEQRDKEMNRLKRRWREHLESCLVHCYFSQTNKESATNKPFQSPSQKSSSPL